MMAIFPFQKANWVILDSSGAAQVTLSPSGGSWTITNTAVSVSSQTNQPIVKLYLGAVTPVNFIGGSYAGANDSNSDQINVQPGTSLFCVWEGGDAGARATLTVTGTHYSPPDRGPAG